MRTAQPRDDVAELLRQGATYRAIRQQLGVSSHVISATRKAYNIPLPTGPGYRPPPEERARIEQRVAVLLLQGATYEAISAEVGLSQPTIMKIRLDWNIPKAVREPRPSRTVAAALALYAEPYGDGHVRWTGPYSGRMPTLFADSRSHNARRVAFREHHGREPVGYVLTDCGRSGCMAGAHLTDLLMRSAGQSGGES
ncbi:helix-turn-helix domain-containing protein [Streptomyces ipomoeae]|uniref:helix-turn-helix domain-containing protein n=1 Tax=Streptomyces ipomoeae TaxID=103232 RepID=UPI0029B615DC|nr:helix-turn-helix domain-containing protein [Streptomyces ipomoeae]MDX2698964.1 helix-turn-helix domain-containing protein [Streptomyces ipomoeae]MDX2844935.1 helix-turn-helix domain-containing protein [Streptomyces ipomoeae]